MTLSRRSPGPIRDYAALLGDKPTKEQLRRVIAELSEDIRRLKLMGYGRPAPHAGTHDADGPDPLTTPGTPTTIRPDDAAGAGDGPSYAYEDHQHAIAAGTPSGLANANSEGAATSFLRSDAGIKRDVRVYGNGSEIATRNALDFVGATVTDLGASTDRVRVDTSPGGSGSSAARHGGNLDDAYQRKLVESYVVRDIAAWYVLP